MTGVSETVLSGDGKCEGERLEEALHGGEKFVDGRWVDSRDHQHQRCQAEDDDVFDGGLSADVLHSASEMFMSARVMPSVHRTMDSCSRPFWPVTMRARSSFSFLISCE